MREALQILHKDVRHLWPRSIPLLVFSVAPGSLKNKFEWNPIGQMVRSIWLISAAFLAVSVVQQESLPGNQQYWLTRPISRGGLLLGKALFLALFTGVPVLVMEALSLRMHGLSVWRHVPLIIASSLLFAGGVCLFAAALASVTANLLEFLWGFLAASGSVIVGFVLAGRQDNVVDWSNLAWVRGFALGGAILIASAVVLWLQYSRRRTALSRCVLGAALLLAAAGPFLGSWHSAWSLQAKFSKQQMDSSVAHVTFDSSHRTPPGFADTVYTPDADHAGINLPVQLAGVPPGTQLVGEAITTRISGPDGRSWASSWTRKGGLYRTTSLDDPMLIPGDGNYWEFVNVDRAFYESVKNSPVDVHTTVAITLLGERKSAVLATRESNQYHSDDGICRVDPGPFAKLLVTCAWVGRAPGRSYVTAISLRNGQKFASLISTGSGSPLPWYGSAWWSDMTLFTPPPATHEMDLETWQAVARFDRELDVPQVRLAGYVARRITDTP